MDLQLDSTFTKSGFNSVLRDHQPEKRSKQVSRELGRLILALPLGNDALPLNPNDDVIKSYLFPILWEIAEVRVSIKDLFPILLEVNKSIRQEVDAFKRDHTRDGRRAQALVEASGSKASAFKFFFKRQWYKMLDVTMPNLSPPQKLKKMAHQKMRESFANFYHRKGQCFRAYLQRTTVQCCRLEGIFNSTTRQLKIFDIGENQRHNDRVDGIAFQLGATRAQMSRWKRDFEFVWENADQERVLSTHFPDVDTWQLIFSMMAHEYEYNEDYIYLLVR